MKYFISYVITSSGLNLENFAALFGNKIEFLEKEVKTEKDVQELEENLNKNAEGKSKLTLLSFQKLEK